MSEQRNYGGRADINRQRPAARQVSQSRARSDAPRSMQAQRNAARAANGRKRRRRKKRNTLLYFIMLLLFVAVALITLSVTVLFNISKIEVTGLKNLSRDSVIAASGAAEGDNLFRLNLTDIENKILSELITLDRVAVARKLPSTLSISVSEEQAGYNIKQPDGLYLLLSKNYRVMRTDMPSPDPVGMVLSGIEPGQVVKGDFVDLKSAEGFDLVQTITEELENQKIDKIKGIDVSNPVNISVNYNNKYKILLGTISGASYKLQFAKEVIGKNLDGGEKGVIDARKEGQLSFRPDDKLYSSDISSAKQSVSSEAGKNKKQQAKTVSSADENSGGKKRRSVVNSAG